MRKITLFLALMLASQLHLGQAQDAASAQNADACVVCTVKEQTGGTAVITVSNLADSGENVGSSTQTPRYLRITIVSPCELGKTVTATATAYGPGAENASVTLTSSQGNSESATHSVTGNFPSNNAPTLKFTATATGWPQDTAIAGTGGRFNQSVSKAPPGLLDQFEADLGNFTVPWGTISVKTKPTAAMLEEWDCCLNGTKKEKGFKKATASAELSATATINSPAGFKAESKEYTVVGYTISGEVSVGIVPTVGMTVNFTGAHTQECDGTKCLKLTGGVTAKAKATLEGTATLKAAKDNKEDPIVIVSVDLFFGKVEAGAQGTLAYDSCATPKRSGTLCAEAITATVHPQLTVKVGPVEETLEFSGEKNHTFWKGTCEK